MQLDFGCEHEMFLEAPSPQEFYILVKWYEDLWIWKKMEHSTTGLF